MPAPLKDRASLASGLKLLLPMASVSLLPRLSMEPQTPPVAPQKGELGTPASLSSDQRRPPISSLLKPFRKLEPPPLLPKFSMEPVTDQVAVEAEEVKASGQEKDEAEDREQKELVPIFQGKDIIKGAVLPYRLTREQERLISRMLHTKDNNVEVAKLGNLTVMIHRLQFLPSS